MQNSRNNNTRRQTWLTIYRVFTVVAITAAVAISAILLGRSFLPISSTQASKVERATTFLQDVGFANPTYLGITPGVEGEYPTFRAEAIGGKSVDLWMRTTPNGGWEIQPVGIFKSVKSADDLARVAQSAVFDWENMPSSIKPRTDGASGEYESRKYDYDRLAKYNPDGSYWKTSSNETGDWPRK